MIRLRQVALVAPDLDPVVDQLGRLLGLEVAHRDPAVATFGLVNAVLPVGHQFVEVVQPTRDATAAGRHLDRIGGDGGYMVICQTDDQPAHRRRATELGIRTAFEADDAGYLIWQLHPGDTGGSFLEIDHQPADPPGDPWAPAGPDWTAHVRTDVVDGITAVELAVPDVAAVSARWRALLDQSAFDNADLRWTEGDRGLVAVDLHAVDPATAGTHHVIGGVDFRLVG
jgi:hypothetical protein